MTVLCISLIFASTLANAVTKEQAVKAGFVYNITKFVVWPSHVIRNDKFNLCIFGDDKLGGGLEALYGKRVMNKPLVLRHEVNDQSLASCHVAFVVADSEQKLHKILKKLNKLPVLTISDHPNFIDHGGMIGLVRDGRRVGFEVDLTAVRAAGLHVSAQLLKLAKKVKGLK